MSPPPAWSEVVVTFWGASAFPGLCCELSSWTVPLLSPLYFQRAKGRQWDRHSCRKRSLVPLQPGRRAPRSPGKCPGEEEPCVWRGSHR